MTERTWGWSASIAESLKAGFAKRRMRACGGPSICVGGVTRMNLLGINLRRRGLRSGGGTLENRVRSFSTSFMSLKRDTTACGDPFRSEEHTSELQSLMRISYAVFCLKKNTHTTNN